LWISGQIFVTNEGEKMKLSMWINDAVLDWFPDLEEQLCFLKKRGFKIYDFSFGCQKDMVDAVMEGKAPGAVTENHKRLLGELGLSYGQSHSGVDNPVSSGDINSFKKHIEAEMAICKALNIPGLVIHAEARKTSETKIHPSFATGNTKDEFFDKNRECYRSLIPLAEKYGVEILIENTGCSNDIYYFIRDGRELREMVDYADHPLINACWDTGHANHHKQFDQYQSIMALGDKLKALHIQDNFGGMFLQDFRFHPDLHQIPLWGNINWDSVMQGLIDVGYKGNFNLEVHTVKAKRNPHPGRRNFIYRGKEIDTLMGPSRELTELSVALMYTSGKYILESYKCFEG
jgi:sugar phosphate isomerase/epimerase